MFEGKTFLGATGMPIENIARVRTRLADWLPEPLTVAAWNVRSLTIGPAVMTSYQWYCRGKLVVPAILLPFLLAVKVAVPRETLPGERRVSLVPDVARRLAAS